MLNENSLIISTAVRSLHNDKDTVYTHTVSSASDRVRGSGTAQLSTIIFWTWLLYPEKTRLLKLEAKADKETIHNAFSRALLTVIKLQVWLFSFVHQNSVNLVFTKCDQVKYKCNFYQITYSVLPIRTYCYHSGNQPKYSVAQHCLAVLAY